MAPKKANVVENHPVSYSSEEEQESGSSGEESGSSDDESHSCAEDSKKDESELLKLAESKESSSSDEESESAGDSDSDLDPETLTQVESIKTSETKDVKKSAADTISAEDAKKEDPKGDSDSNPELLKKKKETRSAVAKRPLEQAESEAKRVKISETEHVKKVATDEKANMFQKLFSDTDVIALLQGVIDFTSTKGDIYEEFDDFYNHVKELIEFDATKVQIRTKLGKLKRKFLKPVKKGLKEGKSEEQIVYGKKLEQKAFDLWRIIWGSNGIITMKARKKLGGTIPMKESGKPEKKVEDTYVSIAREIASVTTGIGLDESMVRAFWESVAEGTKKVEMEEKWRKLKAKEVKLVLQRIEFLHETAKMVLKS